MEPAKVCCGNSTQLEAVPIRVSKLLTVTTHQIYSFLDMCSQHQYSYVRYSIVSEICISQIANVLANFIQLDTS